ncbi:MAG: hypothetical protein U9Q34_03565, partial [Elusimicrobiota bacterium]|nr:hypothetical protein [Elusimicrobiota bacterium]
MKKYLLIFFAGLFVFAACSNKKKYDKAVFIIEKHGIKEVDSSYIRNLLEQRGFAGLASVDRYARLVSADKKIKFYAGNVDIQNIGALFDGALDDVYIRRVFNNSPASKNNMRDGDKVLFVDYDDTKKNTDNIIKFKLKRRSVEKPFFVSVKKERFLFPQIFGFHINRGAAYVKVGSFFKGSANILKEGLLSLTKMGAKSIVFDLRYNNSGNMR